MSCYEVKFVPDIKVKVTRSQWRGVDGARADCNFNAPKSREMSDALLSPPFCRFLSTAPGEVRPLILPLARPLQGHKQNIQYCSYTE